MKEATRLSSPKSWQFIAWNVSATRFRPVGYGMMLGTAVIKVPGTKHPNECAKSHRPYGTGHVLRLSQAINCLATIIRSLWDDEIVSALVPSVRAPTSAPTAGARDRPYSEIPQALEPCAPRCGYNVHTSR